ncbi:PREDICTED: serine/threonine-protein phosphatase 6 regulatory ankyrin repeat subunit B-like isoform X1 [Branchiostoma belcheri]|uniref:Serine/threonine-protein phosphatase 6 regulatory ankyrin repeat subunit B-like isoform X1 n=1 Tax=Branchiostoma belcheri TaxID=7741 RepID=A0A6P4Z442_BRABE|nr:PREDICTED: serine/threonine-protein phosphatase 6 regulatory ankyrin repeat subunit B-like isoform X1 [Branchiostoma belcheri]
MGVKSSSLYMLDCRMSGQHKQTCLPRKPPNYNHNWTELHYTASHGNVEKLRAALRKGNCDVNKTDYYGKTALYWAAYKGHTECVEELILHGAMVNMQCKHGSTPLHAVASLYPDCTALLVQNGADVDVRDKWGVTPMYLSATAGQLECLRILVDTGARMTYKNQKTGEIPKQLAAHKEFWKWLNHLSRNPRSLAHLARLAIRRHLEDHRECTVAQLPLPRVLTDYVALKELDQYINRNTNN